MVTCQPSLASRGCWPAPPLPPPMTLGPAMLDNGALVTDVLSEPVAISGAHDISDNRGWPTFLQAKP
jgi:hypothetical protein